MTRTLSAVFTLVLGLSLISSAAADLTPSRLPTTEADIEASLGSNWYGLFMSGNKVGYLLKSLTLEGEGDKAVYVDRVKTNILGSAQGLKFAMQKSSVMEFDSRPPYNVRRIRIWNKQGKNVVKVDIKKQENSQTFDVIVSKDGKTTKSEDPSVDYTLADLLTPAIWLRKGPKVGEQIGNRILGLDPHEIRTVVARKETGSLEIEVSLPKQGTKFPEVYDAKARLVSGKVDSTVEFRLESQDEATFLKKTLDFYEYRSVKIDKPLGDPATISDLVVEVQGETAATLRAGPRQTIVKSAKGSYLLKLGKSHGQPTKATAADIKEGLAETAAFPANDAQVKALVKQAIGNAKTPKEKVERLVRFVSGYIAPDYNAQDLPVAEILKSKKGDCTEYSTMLTTLARAAGIPARRVHGLIYSGDKKKVFEPHAWNEVVLDGHWVPVDAAWKEAETNATHVRLSIETTQPTKQDSVLANVTFKLLQIKRTRQNLAAAG